MRRWVVCLLVLGLVLAVSPSTAAAASLEPRLTATIVPPDTPAGQQVDWLLEVSGRLPVSRMEAEQHLSPDFLAVVDLAAFNQALATISGPTGLTLQRYQEFDPRSARFLVKGASRWFGAVSIDAAGLVDNLTVAPFLDAPGSWGELDQRLQSLAPSGSLVAARLDEASGDCQVVHGVEPRRPRPLGSGFKLYVLGALAHEIEAGRAAWDEPLALRDDWKSLPTGILQDAPAGTVLPLSTYADLMTQISDNTATDHLLNRLGRDVVERQQVRFDISDPARNQPFLTTRELFILKLTRYPALLRAYQHLPSSARAAFLAAVVARLPLPPLADAVDWTSPRAVNAVEWFASPIDICRAFAGLQRQAATPGLEPVDRALSLNDGGLWLDPAQWPTTWFKGGSEPGVLTLNYLGRTATGQMYVVSAMLTDSVDPLPEVATFELQALIRGAFALASGLETMSAPGPSGRAVDRTDTLGPIRCAPERMLAGGAHSARPAPAGPRADRLRRGRAFGRVLFCVPRFGS